MEPVTKPVDVLGNARYMLLVTYRRNGVAVPTPVWVVRAGRVLWVWTNPDAGKVKRLKRSSRVKVAPCSYRGDAYGPLIEATARMTADDVTREMQKALITKYGIQARLTFLPSLLMRLLRRPDMPSATIAITV